MYKKYKDYFLNFSTSIIYLFAQISILIYFSKFIGIKEAGWFSLSIAVTAPVFMLANFQLKWLLATEKTLNSENLIDYYIFRFFTSGVALLLLISYSLYIITDNEFRILFLLISILKFFESLSDLNYGYLQLNEKFNTIFYLILIRSILSIIVLFISIFYFYNYKFTFIILILIYLFIYIYEILYCIKINFEFINLTKNIKKIFITNWQFSLVSFFYSLRVNLPRYVLGKVNILQLGIFSTLNYMNYGSNFIFGSLSEVTNVKIKKYTDFKKVNNVILNYSLFSIIYSCIVFFIFLFFKSFILKILFKKEVNIDDLTILLIILNGLVLNLLLVIDNMFMIFRFKNDIILLVLLESITLLILYLIFTPQNLNLILLIQTVVISIFIVITLFNFKLRFLKYVNSNNCSNYTQ